VPQALLALLVAPFAPAGLAQEPDPAAASLERARAIERELAGEPDGLHSGSAARWREASDAYAQAGRQDPGGPGYWRAARAGFLAGEQLPPDDDSQAARLEAYEHALRMAEAGLAARDDCAECMLFKAAALAQLGLEKGMWESARHAREMAELLDRAIALEPTHRDNDDNSTLGNLHYSSAILYRAMPDWWIVEFLLGVRGDKERALRHIRTALAMHPRRLDYQVELGALLLCLGTSKDQGPRLEEGRKVLERSLTVAAVAPDAHREQEAARIMLAAPEKACGYAGDKWLEIDKSDALAGPPG